MSILTDKEIQRVLGKDLVIHPFDEGCLTPLGYDLRIGHAVNLTNETIITESGKVLIPPKTSIFIICKENIWLSSNLIGTLHARGSLAAAGLFINSTTVDPNWGGQMTFLVHNLNDSEIELDIDSRFVTLIFHRAKIPTASRPQTNPKNVAQLYGENYGNTFSNKMMSYLTNNEITTTERDFNSMIQNAIKPSFISQLRRSLSNGFWGFLGFIQSSWVNLSKLISLSLVAIILISAIVLLFAPEWFKKLKDITGDNLILIVVIVACLGSILKDVTQRER